jgi:hypothetical protein
LRSLSHAPILHPDPVALQEVNLSNCRQPRVRKKDCMPKPIGATMWT